MRKDGLKDGNMEKLIKLISRPNKFDSLVSVSFSSKHNPQYFFKKKREFVLPFSKKVNNCNYYNYSDN